MNPEDWREVFDKYEALASCARMAEGERGDDYKHSLRALSRRWPGALREGELIGPQRVAARRESALAGLGVAARSRASWTQTPARAGLCWAELHQLIADLLTFRRTLTREGQPSRWERYAAWLASTPGSARWPAALLSEAGLGAKLEVRSAYLCLAARTGLELPQLNALLFARSGRWDRRAEDPPWAHA